MRMLKKERERWEGGGRPKLSIKYSFPSEIEVLKRIFFNFNFTGQYAHLDGIVVSFATHMQRFASKRKMYEAPRTSSWTGSDDAVPLRGLEGR